MKVGFILLSIITSISLCYLMPKEQKAKTIHFYPDTTSNLKNPYMGWTLYSENRWRHANGDTYWKQQDKAAKDHAGVFYLRWKWEDLEPNEGEYAWECDTVFQNLIQGAIDRNLRLAFRAFIHTGTPQYVLDGCETYEHWGKQTPYPDDDFFLAKYIQFIEAFGKKFNNPALVDYVDSYGLGWWGEGHNIKYKNPEKKYESHNRIVKAYAKAFDKVINVVNFGVRDKQQQNMVYNELGFSPRRDGYGSKWFPLKDQINLSKHFPQTPIIAEACYWGNNKIEYHIESEGKKVWNSWRDYYTEVVDLALKTHANYLDMRTEHETKRYLEDAPEAAKKFLSKGGYRIYPDSIRFLVTGKQLTIEHTWTNLGVGFLPNNNRNLGHKYKVAFALFKNNGTLVQRWVSNKIDVSKLVNGNSITTSDLFDLSNTVNRKYKLAVGIINIRENDSKDIALAIEGAQKLQNEWVYISELEALIKQ
ncbi:MAG: hypothetical protein ACK5JD_06415 [Mangrovibacterium sp.]